MSKKAYEKPELKEHGSIEELTKEVVVEGSGDLVFLQIDPDNDILAVS